MKKIYLFLANGFEEIEAITTLDVLRRANILAVSCSITSEKEVVGAHGITVIADLLFNESNFEDADMLVLPGGMPGTSNLNDYVPLKELLKKHAGKKKALAAICAAPLVLGGLGMLHGKKATCYAGYEDLLTGAILSDQPVEQSGNIITANGPGAAIQFALKIVSFFQGEKISNEVSNGIYKTFSHQ